MSPSQKRRAVRGIVDDHVGTTAQACRALGLARSSYYRTSTANAASRAMRQEITALSWKHPRYGYRRIAALLRREGRRINPKRVQRVRRVEGLQVKKRQRRTRRVGQSTAERRRASHRGDVWSWDFVEDQTTGGSRFRVLTLIDEHTRECLAVHAAWSIRAVDVITVVEAAMERHGAPQHIRSDNGPEFIAYAVRDWLEKRGVKTLYIEPGSPWENGHIESFHDKLRNERLNRELFGSLLEARIVIEAWRIEYNGLRPHSALGYLTPEEFASQEGSPRLRSGSALPPSRRTGEPQQPKPMAGLQF